MATVFPFPLAGPISPSLAQKESFLHLNLNFIKKYLTGMKLSKHFLTYQSKAYLAYAIGEHGQAWKKAN